MINDFHTHAFPDQVAKKAIPLLENSGCTKAYTAGTISALQNSMKNAGINRSVICSIATKPDQFHNILQWSKSINTTHFTPLPSVHPLDENGVLHIQEIKEGGFSGIKMHPYYQDFYINDPALYPLYDALSSEGLLVVMHTGYDIAFPKVRRATPEQILEVVRHFPKLKLITTHFGGWKLWDEVEQSLLGKPIYIEISFALQFLKAVQVKQMLESHPEEYLLFGSDSPWVDQKDTIKRVMKLGLSKNLEDKLMYKNAQALLGL